MTRISDYTRFLNQMLASLSDVEADGAGLRLLNAQFELTSVPSLRRDYPLMTQG